MRSSELPTVNDSTLMKFPCFELEEDKMACSKSAPTCKPHQGSNKSFYITNSFSQNFGKELCYSQAPSYNKPSHSNQNKFHADSTVTDLCEVVDAENNCSKPSYENNPSYCSCKITTSALRSFNTNRRHKRIERRLFKLLLFMQFKKLKQWII